MLGISLDLIMLQLTKEVQNLYIDRCKTLFIRNFKVSKYMYPMFMDQKA